MSSYQLSANAYFSMIAHFSVADADRTHGEDTTDIAVCNAELFFLEGDARSGSASGSERYVCEPRSSIAVVGLLIGYDFPLSVALCHVH